MLTILHPVASEQRIIKLKELFLGRTYGRLTIVDIISNGIKSSAVCECECGKTHITNLYSVKNGLTKSCGCMQKEMMSIRLSGKAKESASKDFQVSMRNKMYGVYKRNAETKERGFDLTYEDFNRIIHEPCAYCGIENANTHKLTHKNLTHKGRVLLCNGIDRVDSDLGYTKHNSVSCCSMCNMMKRHHSSKDFIKACKRISEHNKGKYE